MTITQALQRDRFGRCLTFLDDHSTLIPAAGVQQNNLQTLQTAHSDLVQHSGEQQAAKVAGKSSTSLLDQRMGAIHADLTDLSEISQAVDDDHPELRDLFRLPENERESSWLDAADAALLNLPPHLSLFVDYGLDPEFITHLQAHLNGYRENGTGRDHVHDDRAEDTEAIRLAVERGIKALEKLTIFLKLRLRDQPELWAVWQQDAALGDARRAHRVKAKPTV